MRRGQAGVTLIEVMVAVTLLSLLSLGMVLAIQIGLAAYSRTVSKLMDNRRVAGAQRIAQQELEGLIPAFVLCGANNGNIGTKAILFQGSGNGLWMVSGFSLEAGWRGQPRILQLFTGAGDGGTRLLVNEYPYTGASGAAQYCADTIIVPGMVTRLARMIPAGAGGKTFVLADKLAYCRFSYYTPAAMANDPPTWQSNWAAKGWPLAVRIEMAPAEAGPSTLHPITVTAPLHIRRDPDKDYTDGR